MAQPHSNPPSPPSPPSPSPQWLIDLHSPPPRPKTKSNIPDPPGYSAPNSKRISPSSTSKTQSQSQSLPLRKPPSPSEMDTLKLKKAWEIALGPAKALPMNAIMMYMSGNSLQIFSIMMVFMLFKTPLQGLVQTNSVFARFETEGTRKTLVLVKLVYVGMNLLALALGVWKVNRMGLLPTTRSDWLAWETEPVPIERVYYAF